MGKDSASSQAYCNFDIDNMVLFEKVNRGNYEEAVNIFNSVYWFL